MTIQHMVANWKKQNINFVEIMFTPYCIINSKFEQTWDNFLNLYREKIARYDVKKAILSMGHQALHTYKQDPSNFKKQMNMLRIRASLLRLIDRGFDYWRIIHMDDETAAELRLVREFGATNEQIDDAKADLLYFIEMADNYSTPEWEKDKLDLLLDNFIMELIAHRLLM
jgi:hypothetical protein